MNNLRLIRETVTPEKEYVMDYVHQICEAAGEMVFPLNGAAPLVSPGDEVLVGEALAEGICCSCSGTVKALERRSDGRKEVLCAVVDNDRKFRPAEGIGAKRDWSELSRSEILEMIRLSGAVGNDPARFPTAAKLASLDPEDVSRVIVDGSEWEPYISSDGDILATRSHGVVNGLRILLRLFPGAEGVILIGEDKPRAADYILDAIRASGGISVAVTKEGIPLGSEKGIGRLLSGGDDVLCVVLTPAEANAVYEAVALSTPFFRRVVTVAGTAVKNPGNFMVRVGTSCDELVRAAGGVRPGVSIGRAVLGGALSGTSLSSLDVPVQKNTGALLLFSEEPETAESECIRCGRCAKICPAGLMPMLLLKAAEKGNLKEFSKLRGGECADCGACSWVCPSKRPLADRISYTRRLSV